MGEEVGEVPWAFLKAGCGRTLCGLFDRVSRLGRGRCRSSPKKEGGLKVRGLWSIENLS